MTSSMTSSTTSSTITSTTHRATPFAPADTRDADESATYAAALERSAVLDALIDQHATGDPDDSTEDAARLRMLTGDRPTGPLHIGHYLASLRNRVRLQDKGVETFVVIADYQVITDRDSVGEVGANVQGLVLDYLAAGLDPARTTIFTHSAVPALNQAHAAVPVPRHRRGACAATRRSRTSLALSDGRPLSGLLLTYPVHQAADILFCHSRIVPVGRDQPAAPRADTRHRAPFQPEVCRGAQCVRRARGPAQRGPPAPRHGRYEDEQEQGQRHQPARHRRRDGRPGPGRADRLGAADHL